MGFESNDSRNLKHTAKLLDHHIALCLDCSSPQHTGAPQTDIFSDNLSDMAQVGMPLH